MDSWDEIKAGFQALNEEELRGRKNRRSLCASCPGPRDEEWHLTQSTTPIQKEFEWRARRAAVRLGCPSDCNGLFFWLNLLRKGSPRYKPWEVTVKRRQFCIDLQGTAQILLKESSRDSGTIEFVCRASAEFCEKCKTEEMEAGRAAGTPCPTGRKPQGRS